MGFCALDSPCAALEGILAALLGVSVPERVALDLRRHVSAAGAAEGRGAAELAVFNGHGVAGRAGGCMVGTKIHFATTCCGHIQKNV